MTIDISRLDDVAEAFDPRLAYGGPNQISIHLFDCHGGDGPAQHLATFTIPDYSPWDSAWVQPGPYEVAAIMWNFKAAIYAMRPEEDVLLACLTLAGRDDPMRPSTSRSLTRPSRQSGPPSNALRLSRLTRSAPSTSWNGRPATGLTDDRRHRGRSATAPGRFGVTP